MRLRRHFGLLYGVLVLLIVALGSWWVYFLTHEGRSYEQYRLQSMATDRAHAELLVRTMPEIRADPHGQLGHVYPHLLFHQTSTGVQVEIDPAAVAAVRREAHRRQRMFTAEGSFFLLLLAAGATILTLAYHSERGFERARELFLAGATHELKTPLASLRLYTETLDRPELTEADRSRIRQHMLQDLHRQEQLVEQILALGHEDRPGRRERLDLGAETRAVIADLAGFYEGYGASIETNLPDGHCVLAERFILDLLLRNLLSNAVLHSAPPARVELRLERAGRWLRLAVRDHGPGIARKDRRRIFQGFVRLEDRGGPRPRSGGAGLGLYLVKRKAELLGGRIELESEVGRGSTFTLVLPAADGTCERPAAAAAATGLADGPAGKPADEPSDKPANKPVDGRGAPVDKAADEHGAAT
jgi:signal transduction histidine kinase